ncbi:MAG: hypothetical protein M3Y21_06820 [Candidatus Eremiobacteraeota bacterium]|nr:hypothetical protein [Candidatus Eremiobacteraeota bacterium]
MRDAALSRRLVPAFCALALLAACSGGASRSPVPPTSGYVTQTRSIAASSVGQTPMTLLAPVNFTSNGIFGSFSLGNGTCGTASPIDPCLGATATPFRVKVDVSIAIHDSPLNFSGCTSASGCYIVQYENAANQTVISGPATIVSGGIDFPALLNPLAFLQGTIYTFYLAQPAKAPPTATPTPEPTATPSCDNDDHGRRHRDVADEDRDGDHHHHHRRHDCDGHHHHHHHNGDGGDNND